MKNYKQSYFTGILITAIRYAIIISIGMLPFNFLFDNWSAYIAPAAGIGIILSFCTFGFVIDLLTMLFKKTTVRLDENKIIIDNDKQNINYNEVTSISFNLGDFSTRHPKPPYVTLVNNDERKRLVIYRPSLRLLFTLRKRCKNASFIIEELKNELLLFLVIGAICGVLFVIMFISG